jgi:protein-S-isoprenylcysteine O-methyltransferase Ste14/uncharacterized membrane protein (UPF0127 family)
MYHAHATTTGAAIAERLRPAHTHWSRLRGLLGTRGLAPGEGLWIKPCNQVHMIGMRYPVDLAFLDDAHRIVRVVHGLRPGRISPRVPEATSVLEIPAGTVAPLGLDAGAQVAIDGTGDESGRRLDAIRAAVTNLALAALYAFFAAAHFTGVRNTGEWASIAPLVAQETLLVTLFLMRRPSIATSGRPRDWALGIAGTLLPLLMRPGAGAGSLAWIGRPVQVVGLALAVVSILFLGRSIGVVAANRGIRTRGSYSVVRHPVYASYLLGYLGYLASYPSLRNCLLLVATAVMLSARAAVEERFLEADCVYGEYLARVPWRFVPYVY